MGTIKNGGNGAFSGKAGSFIGSSWKGIDYIKGIPKKSSKQPTLKQMEQRLRFGAVLAYLGQVKDIVNMGFKSQERNRATGFNMAIQHAINNAVIGAYPTFEIDYAQVLFSKGTLAKTKVEVTQNEPQQISLSWMVNINTRNSFEGDKLFVLIYSVQDNLFLDFENVALRIDGAVDITLQADFDGQELQVYTFFQQHDSNRCSESWFSGAVLMS